MTNDKEPNLGSPESDGASIERLAPRIWRKKVTEFEMLGGKNPEIRRIRVTDRSDSRPHQRRNRPRQVRVFEMANDGKVSLVKEVSQIAAPDPVFLEIHKQLRDKNSSPREISLLILTGMGELFEQMRQLSADPGPNPQATLKRITSRFKSMQALLKSVQKFPRNTQRDEFDVDGPVFQLCVKRIRSWMEQALRAALSKDSEGEAREILEQWERMLEENREELRRTLKSVSELPPDPDENSANG